MNKRCRHARMALSAILVLGLASDAMAQQDFNPDDVRIPYQKIVLDNGFTVLVHEDHSVPIVAVNMWYHVGSRNEKRGRTGFAHLFEHFFFNGSENHPFGFREAMDDIGANNRNGTTNTDRTNFFEDVPVSALERTLFLESDRLGFLAGYINEEMLERERGVVQNEKRQGENQPYGRVFGRIVESIYPYSHPYSWSTIGKMEDLNAATIEDIQEWYASYYGPNNCVMALAGDITKEQAEELANKYFAEIPPGPPIQKYGAWVPSFDANVRDEMQDRVPQARIYRVYHLPPWGERELHDLELYAQVLSGSKSARLDRSLVFEKELATQVTSFVWDKEMGSNLFVIVTVKPGADVAEAERAMDEVISTLIEEGPSAGELQRAQSRILSGFLRGTERLGGFGGRSDILAESETYGGDPEAYLTRLTNLMAARPGQVQESSSKWLDAHHYTLTVLPYPDLAASGDGYDRSTVPELGEAGEVTFPEVQRASLSNGLEVVLLERHTAPLVNMTLAVDAGYAADPDGAAGLASLALDLMDEGTASRDAFAIVDELDALGASISTGSALDQSFVRLRALSLNLAPALDIYADVIQNPSFPTDMVAINKQRRVATIGQEKAQPINAALRVTPKLLYGEGHSYSNPLTGSGFESTVEAIDRDDLSQWHQAWFHPNNSTLIVAGDTTLEELLPQLESAFGNWPMGEAPSKSVSEVGTASTGKVFLLDKPDAPQSVIVAAHVSEPGGLDEDLAMETVIRNFGRMSTSRLNRNLRLDKHWSYGSFGLLWDARGQRPFVVVAPVQSDKTKEAMVEVLKEINDIAGDRPVVGEEYDSIMRNMTLRLPGRYETLASLEGAAIDLVNYGYDPEYFYNYSANVSGLREDDLAAAAAKFIRPDELFWVVIGDLAQVESGVRELDFGKVVRLDADGNPTE